MVGKVAALWVGVALMSACKTVTPTPRVEPIVAPEPPPPSPTWRSDEAWVRWAGVAIDEAGRVAVVGHRLVAAANGQETPHAVGVVTMFEREGATAWTTTVPGAWVQGVAVETLPDGSVVALFRAVETEAEQTKSVVVAWNANGTELWRTSGEGCRRERPHDIAVDRERIAVVSGCDDADNAMWPEPTSRLTVLDHDGALSWSTEVKAWVDSGDATSIAFGPGAQIYVAGWDGDGSWLLDIDGGAQPPKHGEVTELPLERVAGVVALSGDRLAVVGDPKSRYQEDPHPLLVFDRERQPEWQGGAGVLYDPLAVRASQGGAVHVLTEAEIVSIEPRPDTVPKARALPLREDDQLVGVAAGPDGVQAFVGWRNEAQWGRTVAWIVRTESPVDAWPDAPAQVDGRHPVRWHGDAVRDTPAAAAMVHWIDPQGPEPELASPPSTSLQRSVALGLLEGTPLCPLMVSDSGPDYISYDLAEPRVHARFDDPCVRHQLALGSLDPLTSADYDHVEASIEKLLVAYAGTDSNRPVNPGLGEDLLELAFSLGRGPALASVAFGEAEPEVQAYAVQQLLDDPSATAEAALHDAVDTALCEVGMAAASELARRIPSYDPTVRTANETAEDLTRRLCLLRHHPDPGIYEAYWASLLDTTGTYLDENACSGDWPDDDDPLWGGSACEENETVGREPPSNWGEDGPQCDESSCTLGEEHLRENGSHGWSNTLEFEDGPDGELYVSRLRYLDWFGD